MRLRVQSELCTTVRSYKNGKMARSRVRGDTLEAHAGAGADQVWIWTPRHAEIARGDISDILE